MSTDVSTDARQPRSVPDPAPDLGRGARIFISPLARRLAREANLSLADLDATGPGGRIIKRDVQRAVTASEALTSRQTTSGHPATAEPLTASTREVARLLLRGTARADRMLRLRKRLNASGELMISVNDLVVTAAARAHVLLPAMNVIWTPQGVRPLSRVDIALAIATERGLATPVLRGVDQMALPVVAAGCKDLVDRARTGRLREDEPDGGALTIATVASLELFGAADFAATINPRPSAILTVGAAHQEPVAAKGKVKVGTVIRVTLDVDQRSIDGATAAHWMATFLSLVEEPARIVF